MIEWKPCPFCGNDDLVMSGREVYAFMTGKRMEFYRVKCDTCGAMVDNDFEDADEAIEAWNRRADKVGEWTEDVDGAYICSACGCYDYEASKYCPNCGARMENDDGKED